MRSRNGQATSLTLHRMCTMLTFLWRMCQLGLFPFVFPLISKIKAIHRSIMIDQLASNTPKEWNHRLNTWESQVLRLYYINRIDTYQYHSIQKSSRWLTACWCYHVARNVPESPPSRKLRRDTEPVQDDIACSTHPRLFGSGILEIFWYLLLIPFGHFQQNTSEITSALHRFWELVSELEAPSQGVTSTPLCSVCASLLSRRL